LTYKGSLVVDGNIRNNIYREIIILL
jgi:hypothetical protein